MRTRTMAVLAVGLTACGGGSGAGAASTPPAGPGGVPAAVDRIGETATCPVSGETFRITADSPRVEHRGTTYYLCCAGCEAKFRADPEGYIAKGSAKTAAELPSTAGSSAGPHHGGAPHPEPLPTAIASSPGTAGGVCKEIASSCHAVDAASAEAHACHVFGHDPKSSQEACAQRRTACLSACAEAAKPAASSKPAHPHH